MLRKYGKKFVADYFSQVLKARGESAYQKLQQDCESQWEKGNRGNKGDWRD